MDRCKLCLLPTSHPSVKFTNGVCWGCVNYLAREDIDWNERKKEFKEIVDKYRNNATKDYDCVIAVSGGKDSYWIVDTLVNQWDMHPLLVTVNDSFTHTNAGKENLRHLIEYYNLNHYEYTISHDLFIRATRWAFEQLGTPLKFVEYAIYLIPYFLAQKFGIGLVVYGENAAYEYGATNYNNYTVNGQLHHLVRQLNDDMDWWRAGEVYNYEILSIMPTIYTIPECIYMSYFYPWSSVEHLEVAKENGFKTLEGEWDRQGCMEDFEQIDSYGYITHLWLRYPRLGFQRVTDIATRRVREGRLSKKEAQKIIKAKDHCCDSRALEDFCKTLGYGITEWWNIVYNASWNKYYKVKEK